MNITFYFPNGHIWKGTENEVGDSIGLSALDKNNIRMALNFWKESTSVNEFHFRTGHKLVIVG